MYYTDNPWEFKDTDSRKKAIKDVRFGAEKISLLAPKIPALKTDILKFSDNLKKIAVAYEKDDTTWRHSRALSVVHIPSIRESLEGLVSSSMDAKDPRRISIENDLKVCMTLAQSALESIADKEAMILDIQTKTLMGQTGLTVITQETPPQEENIEPKKGRFSSLTSKIPAMPSLPTETWTKLNATVTNTATSTLTSITSSIGASGQALGAYASYYMDQGLDFVATPVTSRGRALVDAVSSVGALALVSGGVTALIFPPAAPFIMGLSVLEAPNIYQESLKQIQKENGRNKRERETKQEETIYKAIKTFGFGKSPIARIETPYVMFSLDTQTGQSDGIILSGRYTGELISSLNTTEIKNLAQYSPDKETQQVLLSWLKGYRDQ
jgi:hypothetical protein